MCEIKPCINPNCVDGWDTGRRPPATFANGRFAYLRSCPGLRCCTACGGRGFHASERDNRRHYYDMRALAAELESGRPDEWDTPLPIASYLPGPALDPAARTLAAAFEDLSAGPRTG